MIAPRLQMTRITPVDPEEAWRDRIVITDRRTAELVIPIDTLEDFIALLRECATDERETPYDSL